MRNPNNRIIWQQCYDNVQHLPVTDNMIGSKLIQTSLFIFTSWLCKCFHAFILIYFFSISTLSAYERTTGLAKDKSQWKQSLSIFSYQLICLLIVSRDDESDESDMRRVMTDQAVITPDVTTPGEMSVVTPWSWWQGNTGTCVCVSLKRIMQAYIAE